MKVPFVMDVCRLLPSPLKGERVRVRGFSTGIVPLRGRWLRETPHPSPLLFQGRGGTARKPSGWLNIVLAASVALAPIAARAQTPPPVAPAAPAAGNLDSSIARGLAYLAQQQNPDGSFDGGGPKIAMTALALMSFLACGHAPDAGKYGLHVRRSIDFLLSKAPEDGYFGKVDGSRMYGQGIVTLALAEAYGVDQTEGRRKIQPVLSRAVELILKAQQVPKAEVFAGGWRYEPKSADSDLSLSGWNALALRAAQNVGMNVPKEQVEQAVQFVLKCFHKEQKGFSYRPGEKPTNGLTGVGVLNLYLLDAADRPEVRDGAIFLVQNPVKENSPFPYYYAYYTTQAAFQAGEPTWSAVWKITQDRLLALQMPDGGWPTSKSSHEPGRIYATTMSLLTLSVPYRLLPIYQR